MTEQVRKGKHIEERENVVKDRKSHERTDKVEGRTRKHM